MAPEPRHAARIGVEQRQAAGLAADHEQMAAGHEAEPGDDVGRQDRNGPALLQRVGVDDPDLATVPRDCDHGARPR